MNRQDFNSKAHQDAIQQLDKLQKMTETPSVIEEGFKLNESFPTKQAAPKMGSIAGVFSNSTNGDVKDVSSMPEPIEVNVAALASQE